MAVCTVATSMDEKKTTDEFGLEEISSKSKAYNPLLGGVMTSVSAAAGIKKEEMNESSGQNASVMLKPFNPLANLRWW